MTSLHRLVAAAFIGECPERIQVNHKNGKKLDNRPENLEYVTAQANMLHRSRVLGKCRRGDHPSAKLTEGDIARIRLEAARGTSQKSLAAAFRVHHQTIWNVVNDRSWRDDPNAPAPKPKRKKTPEPIKQQVCERFASGETIRSIANALGIARANVRTILVRRGFDPARNKTKISRPNSQGMSPI